MAARKKAAGERAITLHDHIKELRNRLFVVAIVFLAVSALAYNYKDTLIYYLLKPLGDEKLIYLNPAGGFSFIFQVTMYVGIAAAVPFLVYNLYKFVAPALPGHARKHSAAVMLFSLLLLGVGVSFGYIFAIPGALSFLNNFAEGYVTASLTAESYLNFILAYTAGLGILFQLPLILMFIHWIHPLKPIGLLKFERYMVLIAFVAAAMITPTPDIMNQLVIALPIIVMYQMGFIAICISVHRQKRRYRSMAAAAKGSEQVIDIAPLAAHTYMPEMPVLTERPRRAQPKAAPVAIPVVLHQPATRTTPQVAAPQQARRSMDMMVMPAGKRPRAVHHERSVTLRHSMPVKAPVRARNGLSGSRIASIDGVSII